MELEGSLLIDKTYLESLEFSSQPSSLIFTTLLCSHFAYGS